MLSIFFQVEIESIRHKALCRFFATGNREGLDARIAERLGRMLFFLVNAGSVEELSVPPDYGLHPLTGDLAGRWAMTVTKNWRLTFKRTGAASLADLDLEDYH